MNVSSSFKICLFWLCLRILRNFIRQGRRDCVCAEGRHQAMTPPRSSTTASIVNSTIIALGRFYTEERAQGVESVSILPSQSFRQSLVPDLQAVQVGLDQQPDRHPRTLSNHRIFMARKAEEYSQSPRRRYRGVPTRTFQ